MHCLVALRVHVPIQHRLWAQCTYIGSTLRPMCILCEYMVPWGCLGFRLKGLEDPGFEGLWFWRAFLRAGLRDTQLLRVSCSVFRVLQEGFNVFAVLFLLLYFLGDSNTHYKTKSVHSLGAYELSN